ncbi:MAG: aminotransferase class I/II-fold pyridoxal phosphate-dependent enzyme [Deltaproteobacteria bacterium]|jgi:threonine-phosphate decarboxylase|nr:aminotransferase class I/II-fold pyridoxal phosphate-dependent enzyme [Deltaproteobacteria bacterium]
MSIEAHGGRVHEAARILQKSVREIADFSANLNPCGQPKGLRACLSAAWADAVHYPEPDAGPLTAKIAAKRGLDPRTVVPGAGSTPLIYRLVRVLAPRRLAVLAPAFSEYAAAAAAAGLAAEHVSAPEENGWLVDLPTVERLVALKPDLVFAARPANPTGRLIPPEPLEALIEAAESRGFQLVLDEAFLDFAVGAASLESAVARRPRLTVLRSLTKIFAVPGLRLGYLAAAPDLADRLRRAGEPWAVSSPALAAGLFCLEQDAFMARAPLVTARLRRRLEAALAPYGQLTPSDVNYVLFRAEPARTRKMTAFLFQRGLLVRDAANMPGLGPGWLRFAVRPAPELQRLETALEEFDA